MVLERELVPVSFAPDLAQRLVEDHLERLVEAELVIDVTGVVTTMSRIVRSGGQASGLHLDNHEPLWFMSFTSRV